jgi:hypothetical protein
MNHDDDQTHEPFGWQLASMVAWASKQCLYRLVGRRAVLDEREARNK